MSKLPVWQTVGQSYAFTFRNLGLLIRVAWVWFAAFAATVWLLDTLSLGGALGAILSSLAFTLAACAVAVAWHRAVLIGARPATEFSVSFGHREVAYFLITLAITIVCYVGILAVAATVIQVFGPGLPALTALTAIVVVLLLAVSRVSLKISAVTVDDASMTFARSWELTSGATWRLTVGFLVSAVPLSLLMLPVKVRGLAADADPTSDLDIALGIASGALSFIAIAVGASFLSFAYLRLVPEYEKAAIGAM